jgi:hypothetical protein
MNGIPWSLTGRLGFEFILRASRTGKNTVPLAVTQRISLRGRHTRIAFAKAIASGLNLQRPTLSLTFSM